MPTVTRTLRALVVLATVATSVFAVSVSPAGADAALVIDPSTDVVDGTAVSVQGTGFPTKNTGATAMCDGRLDATNLSLDLCDISDFRLLSTGEAGAFGATLTAKRFIRVGGETIDCAVAGACVVAAASVPGFFDLDAPLTTANVAWTPITFSDASPTDGLTIELSVGNVSHKKIDMTISCNKPVDVTLEASVAQPVGAGLEVTKSVRCSSTPKSVNLGMRGHSIRFVPGDLDWSVEAHASDDDNSAFTSESGTTETAGGRPRMPRARNTSRPDLEVLDVIDGFTSEGKRAVAVVLNCPTDRDVWVWAELTQSRTSVVRTAQAGTEYSREIRDLPTKTCFGETTIELPIEGKLRKGRTHFSLTVQAFSGRQSITGSVSGRLDLAPR